MKTPTKQGKAYVARKAADSRRIAQPAKVLAPGSCPECGAPEERTEDNGLRRSASEYSIRCQDCDHRWEPNQSDE